MSRIILPSRGISQLSGFLDNSHWLVKKGLVFYSPAPGIALSGKGQILPLSHAMPDSPDGTMGLTVVGNAVNYDDYAISLPGSTPFTLIAWGKVVDTTNDHVLLGVGIAGQNEHRALISMDGTDSGGIDRCYAFCKDGTAAVQVFTAAGAYTANRWHMVTGIFGSATDMRIYRDGALQGAQTSGVNFPTTTMTRLFVGSAPGVSPSALRNGDRVSGCICVLGALTEEEVSRLYYEQLKNPWSLLKPASKSIWFDSAVGGGTQNLAPSLYSDTDTFFSPTASTEYALTPALFADEDTFYSPTVGASNNLSPALFNDADTFYSPVVGIEGGTQALLPALFTDGDIFYSPTVIGDQLLLPSLFADSDIFYSPTVTAPGAMTLTQADIDAIVAAVLSAAQTTPIHADTRKMNGATVAGDGSSGNLWRGA